MFRLDGIAMTAGFVATSALIVTGVIGIVALWGNPALAFGPQPAVSGPSLVVPVMDEEDSAVQRDLEPDEMPKTKSGGEMVPVPDRARTDADNVEQEELKRDLETGD